MNSGTIVLLPILEPIIVINSNEWNNELMKRLEIITVDYVKLKRMETKLLYH